MHDPLEGVDEDGRIVTGVAIERIPDAFAELVREATVSLQRGLGSALHAVHLYGSVATGQAIPGRSDLDLVVVLADGADDQRIPSPDDVVADLVDPSLVRGIGVGAVALRVLTAGDRNAWAERAFLDTYTVRLAGDPLPGEPVRPVADRSLADAWAGDLLTVLPRVADGHVPAPTSLGRRLLMTAAMLASVEAGGWSTDRERGADAFSDPADRGAAMRVLAAVDSRGDRFGEEPATSDVAALARAIQHRWAPG